MQRLSESKLGTAEALAQTLAIGPVVSVGFAAYLVAGTSGGAVTVTILLAFAGAAALGWVLTRFARRYAGAGGIYEYLVATSPPAAAVAVGTAYFLVGLLTAAAGLVGGIVAQGFAIAHLGTDPGWVVPALVIVAIVATPALLGIRLAARTILAVTVVAAIPLLVVAAAALAQGLSLRPLDPGAGDVLAGLPYAVLLFMGFEAACCLGEESRDPRRSIPRAIPVGIAASGLFYAVLFFAITLGMGTAAVAERWGGDPFAVVGLADELVGAPVGALVHAAVLVDILALGVAGMNLGSRGWLTLARDGLAPRALARVSRWGTPLTATLLMVGANVTLVGAGLLLDNPLGVFEATYTAGPLVVLGVYVVLCTLAIRVIADEGRAWRWGALALASAVPVLGLYGTLDPWPAGAREAGLYLAAGVVAVAAAWSRWLVARRPATVASLRRAPAPAPGPAA